MVRSGMAWHDDYNAPDATKLAAAMKNARKAKKGLWADKNPIKPYLFRKGDQQQPEPTADPEGDEVICHYVQDGDTFKLPDNETRVRLWGIDAPEKGQAYADEARNRLKELCEGKAVRLEVKRPPGEKASGALTARQGLARAARPRPGLSLSRRLPAA